MLMLIFFLAFHPVFVYFPHPVWARTPVKEIVNDLYGFDGKKIEITGEVVGDIMERRKGVWLNIDDGTESIGVWATKDILPKIEYIGKYGVKGDMVSVEGIFNRSCPLHGGETDIHAYAIQRLHVGYPIPHPISPQKIEWSLILFGLAMVTVFVYWWQHRWSE